MTSRRMRAAERRAMILDAAVEVFAEQGAVGATLTDVAQRADVTKALLYRHVESKDELYRLALEAQADELIAAVTTALDGVAGLDDAAARAAIDAFLGFVEARPQAYRLLFRDPGGGPAVAVHERVQAALVDALRSALAADPAVLPDTPGRDVALEASAHLLKAGLNGLAAWWWANADVPRADVVERAMALLGPGLSELKR